jgi:hypothetical protein
MSTTETVAQRSAATDLAWRILALLNLFRLLVPIVLTGLFTLLEPPPVGQVFPAFFVGVLTAYFLFALVSISGLKRRWPDASTQVLLHVAADLIAINLLTFASGGLISGSRPADPPGGCWQPDRSASAGADVCSTRDDWTADPAGFSILQGHGDWGDFAPAGIVGAIAFIGSGHIRSPETARATPSCGRRMSISLISRNSTNSLSST